MRRLREVRDWIYATPKRKAIASYLVIVAVMLLTDVDDVLADPLNELGLAAISGLLVAYLTYTLETRRKLGQPIPAAASIPLFTLFKTVIRIMLVGVVLASLGILIAFRIENWGGGVDQYDELRMKLIGLAFLLPISIPYLCGLMFGKSLSGLWVGLSGVGALGLYLWNSMYLWHTPQTHPGPEYEQLSELLSRLPFVPIVVMLIAGVLWLIMIWPKPVATGRVEMGR